MASATPARYSLQWASGIGLWMTVEPKLANRVPIQIVSAMGFLVCLGFHYNIVLPFQFKDDLCSKLIINGPSGRPSACSTSLKYSHLFWYCWCLSCAPFFVVALTGLFPEVCCLDAAFQDLKEHLGDVEDRMNEALDEMESNVL
ncbi:hypothetical protein Ae201684P_016688 [Aphanomyces euteiches]|uniref:Uncharacterized protein n=1 Tax=Aphanomyces euteiches TaxID=100861 RepID=A0A6G0WGA5_9STRA|nr:hypothetical protein Ae201684_015700 [Aphanomyces euteiches]KAH9094072.1 hypothetical protein Ae201684P_016688 [Aphanomyces euteiches]